MVMRSNSFSACREVGPCIFFLSKPKHGIPAPPPKWLAARLCHLGLGRLFLERGESNLFISERHPLPLPIHLVVLATRPWERHGQRLQRHGHGDASHGHGQGVRLRHGEGLRQGRLRQRRLWQREGQGGLRRGNCFAAWVTYSILFFSLYFLF